MMRSFVLMLLMFFPWAVFSQGFELLISTQEDEMMTDGIENSAGNFILCGAIGDFVSSEYDSYIMEISPAGAIVKSKRFTEASGFSGFSKIFEVAGGYLAFGAKWSNTGANDGQVMVRKLDGNLNEVWTKTYSSGNYDHESLNKVRQTADGNYIGIGLFRELTPMDNDVFIFRFDANGDSLIAAYYPFFDDQFGWDILELDSNRYKAFTYFVPDGIISLGNEIVVLDSSLNMLSIKRMDTLFPYTNGMPTYYFNALTAKWLNDSIYMTVARAFKPETLSQDSPVDIGLLFLDSNDSVRNAIAFGKPDTNDAEANHSLDFIYPSAIYTGGSANCNGSPFENTKSWYNLNKIDASGNVLWEKFYGGDAHYFLWKIVATQDSGCLMMGTRYDAATANGLESDIYIIKVGPDGVVSVKDDEHRLTKNNFLIYPNPASAHFTIQGNFELPAVLELFDNTGKKVKSQRLQSNKETISTRHLPAGVYLYKVHSRQQTATGKLMIIPR